MCSRWRSVGALHPSPADAGHLRIFEVAAKFPASRSCHRRPRPARGQGGGGDRQRPSFHYGGSWTAGCLSTRLARWVDFAETFHLPIVYLMGCLGFMIGLDAEKGGYHPPRCVRAMAAVIQTTVSWCTVILRSAFGVAGIVHQPADRFSRCATPSHRPVGALCRSKAASRPLTALTSMRPGTKAAQLGGVVGPAQQAALAVPLGREIPGTGDYRPPQGCPLAAVRVRAPR